jgi:hypothetical protein
MVIVDLASDGMFRAEQSNLPWCSKSPAKIRLPALAGFMPIASAKPGSRQE